MWCLLMPFFLEKLAFEHLICVYKIWSILHRYFVGISNGFYANGQSHDINSFNIKYPNIIEQTRCFSFAMKHRRLNIIVVVVVSFASSLWNGNWIAILIQSHPKFNLNFKLASGDDTALPATIPQFMILRCPMKSCAQEIKMIARKL